MTIALPIPASPDDVSTYDGLVEAIVATLQDSTLTTHAPRFIYLAESRFNRLLYNLEMEGVSTSPAAARMALPTDFRALRSIHLATDPLMPLSYMSPDVFHTSWAFSTTGKPQNYSIIANEIVLGPSPDDTYSVSLTYMRGLVGLSESNTSNWLLESHADLYLYASLMHAEFFGWNDARLPVIKAFVDEMIAELNAADSSKRFGGPIRLRPSSVA